MARGISVWEELYVLELADESSGLRLTATLAKDIKAALGEDDLDDWIDRVVEARVRLPHPSLRFFELAPRHCVVALPSPDHKPNCFGTSRAE
jgi:hypothetical protein